MWVCDGLNCEMVGAQRLLGRLPGLLGADLRVLPVPCVGRCEQAPAVVVHQHPVSWATVNRSWLQSTRISTRHEPEPYADHEAYAAQFGHALLRDCVEGRRDLENVLKTMEDSSLRGQGGAGFPAGRKWHTVRSEAALRLVAVDIDEGELGTFKHRCDLERDLHRFLEGMLIATGGSRRRHDSHLPARRAPQLPYAARG